MGKPGRRRLLAPEVVQTSAMDCGPAALKCLLDGLGRPISYGRLREACQTSVDGTSIDTIEMVARDLGLQAEQVLVPADFICQGGPGTLPALVVVRHAENFTHFVVVWSRHGQWLQVMDPAVGRRWVRAPVFEREVFRHEQSVDAHDWRDWCDSGEFLEPFSQQLAALGFGAREAEEVLGEAKADPGWFGYGALDASVRLGAALAEAGGLRRGREAVRVVSALFRDTAASGHDIYALIPPSYWSARPDLANTDASRERLVIAGGVMLKAGELSGLEALDHQLSPELVAALGEAPPSPLRQAWQWLHEDGAMRPATIGLAIAAQALALLVQALSFRALLDIANELALPVQRLIALGAIALLALLTGLIDFALARQSIRLGRQLEAVLRRAILAKLPRLHDRYFQSRPITDMADRSHNLHMARGLPALLIQSLQAATDLALTFAAIAWFAPEAIGWALASLVAALAVPLLLQPLFNERELRVRNHGAALYGFFLDSLLGLAPIRVHRSERAVARQYEGLLVDWVRACRSQAQWQVAGEGLQLALATGFSAALILSHFAVSAGVSGADLLLVFWAMRLPAAADRVGQLARRYPVVRNALLRQMEPLDALEEEGQDQLGLRRPAGGAVGIDIRGGRVLAGGHEVLREVELSIRPGEHVAIVGKSGAGKSTLLGVLLGWHKLEAGEVLVDGEALRGERLLQLRQVTAWVDPQVQIWNRTLLDNLTFAVEERDFSQVRHLVEASGLMGVSSRLPSGLQTALGEGGGLLSGGEGQRVRLGRALLTDGSRLALLDEPFRGLDREQRRSLLQSARGWWRDTTLLCVTHDIAETLDFDRVLVIEDGRIVEDGNPRQLAHAPSRYRALCEAEQNVLRGMWGEARWRRWKVGGGQVEEAAVAA